MKTRSKVLLLLIVALAMLALAGCGGSEPPDEAVLTALINQRDGVEGQYTFGFVECFVDADQVGIVENWDVSYTRVDVEGAEMGRVHAVKNEAGEWSLEDREGCGVR